MSDEDGERIDAWKFRMNVSEVARNALLQEVQRLEGRMPGMNAVSSTEVANRLKKEPSLQKAKKAYEARHEEGVREAEAVGALLVEKLVEDGFTFDDLVEMDSLALYRVPPDIDRDLLRDLQEALNLVGRSVPEDFKHAARKGFRDTVRLVVSS
jgi:hypothetical protein